jgi:hypothetical protein
MSRHTDDAAAIIAPADVRRRASGRRDRQDHHLAVAGIAEPVTAKAHSTNGR